MAVDAVLLLLLLLLVVTPVSQMKMTPRARSLPSVVPPLPVRMFRRQTTRARTVTIAIARSLSLSLPVDHRMGNRYKQQNPP
uniref:Putative secreted protein n=1 Tax=Anopheles darlingi TaxID=43151 RepID=A0A2M4DCU5_ANODA